MEPDKQYTLCWGSHVPRPWNLAGSPSIATGSHGYKLMKNIPSSYNSSERCEDENGLKVDEALLRKAVCVTATPGSWVDVEMLPFTKRIL